MKDYLEKSIRILLLLGCALLPFSVVHAEADPVSVAVLDFSVSQDDASQLGQQIAELLTVSLTVADGLILVDRTSIDKVLSEQQLGLSGAINSATAAHVGELVGAKVLISGRVMSLGQKTIIVAKVIGTETSRVFASKVSMENVNIIDEKVDELGMQISELIQKENSDLLAPTPNVESLVDKLKHLVAGHELPAVSVDIEEVHIGRAIPDPAAQTEVVRLLQQLGFDVYPRGDSKVDVEIIGEAFSEFAGRYSGLVSCRARVEIEMKEFSTNKLIWADRENAIGLDVAEHFSGKKALQKAGAELSERIVHKLTENL